jgi:hypothetical protein
MQEDGLLKMAMELKPKEKRPVVRSRTEWMDQVRTGRKKKR